MLRSLVWFLLFTFAITVMAVLHGVAIGFGVPHAWAVSPFITALGWIWASRMFQSLNLT